jgi:hypothetical protein
MLFFGVQNTGVQSSFTARPEVDEIELSEEAAHKQLSHWTEKQQLAAPQQLS